MARRTSRTLEVRIKAVEAKLTAFDKLKAKSRQTEKAVGGLAKMGDKLKTAFAGWATQAVMGSFRAVGAAVSKANASFVEFESSVARIKTLIPGQVALQNKLAKSAEALSKAYGLAATDAANATFQAISAGVSAADAGKFMKVAAENATAGFNSMEESVAGLTTVINAYGLEVGEATAISDAMFTANKLGVTTSRELGASLGAVVPMAANLGVSYRELMSGVVALTKQGTSTAESMTRMRAILASLIKPTKVAADESLKLGIAWDINVVKAGGFSAVIDTLRKVSLKGGEESLSKLIGRVEGTSGAMALASVTGLADFKGALAEMETQSGQTREALDEITDSEFFKQKKAVQELEGSWRELGKVVAPIMTGVLKFAAHPIEFQIQGMGFIDEVEGLSTMMRGLDEAVDAYTKRLSAGQVTSAQAVQMFHDLARAGRDLNAELGEGDFLGLLDKAALHMELMGRQAGFAGENMGELEDRAEGLLRSLDAATGSSAALNAETAGLITTFEQEIARLSRIETGYKGIAKASQDSKTAAAMRETARATAAARDRVRELLGLIREMAGVDVGTPALDVPGVPKTKDPPKKRRRRGPSKAAREAAAAAERQAGAVERLGQIIMGTEIAMMRLAATTDREKIAAEELSQEMRDQVTVAKMVADGLPFLQEMQAESALADVRQAKTKAALAVVVEREGKVAQAASKKKGDAADAAANKITDADKAAKKAHEDLILTLGQAISTDGIAGLEAALGSLVGKSQQAKNELAELAIQSTGSSAAMIGASGALQESGEQAFGAFANGVGEALGAFAEGEMGFAEAMHRMTASVLLNLGKQAATESLMEVGRGLAAAAIGSPTALGHFAAAAAFAGIAGVGLKVGGSMSRGIAASDKRKDERKQAAEGRKRDADRGLLAKQGRAPSDTGAQTRESVINIHVAGAHLTRREAGAAGARAAAAARRARMTPNADQEVVM